jgi:hypothetical protein
MHWRRAQHGSDKDALRAFKGSEFEAKLREATKTEKRPDGVGGSLALLRRSANQLHFPFMAVAHP